MHPAFASCLATLLVCMAVTWATNIMFLFKEPRQTQAGSWWERPSVIQPPEVTLAVSALMSGGGGATVNYTPAGLQRLQRPPTPPPSQFPSSVPSTGGSVRSTHQCQRMSSWSDVCVYTDVCFGFGAGGDWSMKMRYAGAKPPFYISLSALNRMRTAYVAPPKPFPDRKPDGRGEFDFFPLNAGSFEVEFVDHGALKAQGVATTWLPRDSTLWVTSHAHTLPNIWYYSSRLMPIYQARSMNRSGTLGMVLPPVGSQDHLLMPSPSKSYVNSSWFHAFAGVAIGAPSISKWYRDSPYVAQWNKTNLLCVHSAVVTGVQGYVFPDPDMGFQVRQDLYEAANKRVASAPPQRVLIFLRQGGRRHLMNANDLELMVQSLGIPYTLVTNHPDSFEEQVELFASHGIVIQPHGAGEVNIMFMPPGSAAIELFPYHFDHTLYAGLSALSGVGWYPAHAINASWVFREGRDYFRFGCDEWSSLAVNNLTECRQHATLFPFFMDIEPVRVALVNAMRHIGMQV